MAKKCFGEALMSFATVESRAPFLFLYGLVDVVGKTGQKASIAEEYLDRKRRIPHGIGRKRAKEGVKAPWTPM